MHLLQYFYIFAFELVIWVAWILSFRPVRVAFRGNLATGASVSGIGYLTSMGVWEEKKHEVLSHG